MVRRTLLRRGIWGGALLAFGGVGFVATRASVLRSPPNGLVVFDALEYSVLFALAERMLLPKPHWPPLSLVDPVFNADVTLRLASPLDLKDLRQLIRLFENPWVGGLLNGRPQPFTALSPQAQDDVLSGWRDSRLEIRRTGYAALRTLLAAAYFGDPRTYGVAHYPGPPSGFHAPDAPVWKGDSPP